MHGKSSIATILHHSCDATFDPSKPFHYGHGAYLGHMLPGWFFVLWGSWWAISIVLQYVRVRVMFEHTWQTTPPLIPQCTAKRRPYVARAWFPWPTKPQWLSSLPLEPWCKVLLPFIGINGELWAGHESWR